MRSTILFGLLPLALAAPFEDRRAPLHVPRGATGDSYIVKMKAGAPNDIGIQAIKPDANQEFTNLGAFSAILDDEDLERLRLNPQVEFVEKEQQLSIFASVTQTNATWGIARLSSTTTGATTYTYDDVAGAGACAYVIDTGVDETHPEFEGRASLVANKIDSDPLDRNGHGTHVAGTLASKTYGVAKKTTIFAVKAFGPTGSSNTSIIASAMDFVLGDFPSKASLCPKGIVVNMSLGGPTSPAMDDAATALVNAGLAVAVAAGNGARDASTMSPARVASVCTVGSTDVNDVAGSSSNYGTSVDIHAPGVNILSTIPGGGTALSTGTSMATPHVAGLMAYYLALNATTPSAACEYIVANALSGRITSLKGMTTNLLAHLV